MAAKGQASKIAVWIILTLLIVGLAGFGATNFGTSVQTVASVGDTEIDVDRYARELNGELRAFQAETGQNITFAQAQLIGLDRNVLQRLLSAAALEDEAARIGLSAGDEQVQKQILGNRAFQGLNGKFDRTNYESILRQNGMTPARYENIIRADAAVTLLQAAVGGAVTASNVYADTLVEYIGARRNFSWIELDQNSLDTPIAEPDEAALRAFYEDNQDDFMLPATRSITYAWVSPDDLLDQIEPNEDAVRALYDSRSDDYNLPERRLAERLIYPDEASAADAMDRLSAGSVSFEDLVAERGLTLGAIDLGDVTQQELGKAGQMAFATTQPGVVGPIDTDLGPTLIRVNAILDARNTPFEDVRDELWAEYAGDAARRMIADMIESVDDLLASGATLEELAKETPMTIGHIDWFEGTDEGISGYESFYMEAARVSAEDYPVGVEMEDGGLFALRLDNETEAAPEPFEDAIDRIADAWTISELTSRLSDQAAEIKAQLDNGVRIGALGLPVTVETHATRDTLIDGATDDFVTSIFALEENGQSLVSTGEGRVLIAQLTQILPADESDPDIAPFAARIQDDFSQSIARDSVAALIRAVQQDAGITINQQALNALNAQFQ